MEKILDEYGRFLLDLLAMGFLIAYLFGTVTDDAGHCSGDHRGTDCRLGHRL